MPRQTRQRAAIQRALITADRPLTIDEILASTRKIVPTIGIATAYRNIRRLVDEGWLTAVDIPGGPARYEITGKDHHHHFVCLVCDRVFEVPSCPSDLEKMSPAGFSLDHHEVVLYGKCADCR
ncbi:MAG: transcriptional repressor [Candidatus Latescibacterota bacterium]|nr:MAG: transcriptional repressor [Candidatus Latescibacterota bacterium]